MSLLLGRHRDKDVPPTGETSGQGCPSYRGDIGPTSVVRVRLHPNGSGSLGKHARASDDPELQGEASDSQTHSEGNPLACACGMARDRPSPYVKGERFFIV